MWLLIDDKRDLYCDVIARTSKAGFKMLALGGWDTLCIDHDLGEEISGYDIIVWASKRNFLPNHIQIVSSNPVGKQNIANVLKDNGYTTKDNINYNVV